MPRLPRFAWVVLGGDALSAFGTGLTLPFLLVYLSRVRGIDLAVAGLIIATIAVASLIGNPLGGALSDRVGARNAVICGLVLAAVGAVLLTFVRQPWHGFAATAVVGLGAAVIWPAQDALLATLVRPEQRSSAFALRYATMNLGLGLGAFGAAVIVEVSSPQSFVLVYLIDAATFMVFVPVLLTIPNVRARSDAEDGAPVPGRYAALFGDRVFLRVWLLTAIVVLIGYGQYHAGFPAYATRPGGIDASALSLAFAANAVTVVVAQLFVLRLLHGRKRTSALAHGCGAWALAWGVTLVAGQLGGGWEASASFALAMVIFALAETFMSPTMGPIVNDLAPEHLRGRYNGASTLAWTTGFLIGPIVAGFTLDAGLGTELFAGLIVACVLAAIGARRLERHLPPEANVVG